MADTATGEGCEHWRQNPDSAFPYYVFRTGADLGINKALTWNVVSFRYRDAFNPDEHFITPQLATGLHLQTRRAAIDIVAAPAQLSK